MTTLNEDLIYEILSAVEEIPAGKVAGRVTTERPAAGRLTAESLGGQDRQKGSSEWNREFCSIVSLWTRNF